MFKCLFNTYFQSLSMDINLSRPIYDDIFAFRLNYP